MKKRLFFSLGVVCSLGLYSCQKTMVKEDQAELAADVDSRHRGNDCGCIQVDGSTIFDPTCLVSPSSHGKLDTIQKGFSFTEGPAVDKWGNVFFTDQPNDKIYRW